MAVSKVHGRALWKIETRRVRAKLFKKGELEALCSLDFHFKELNNRFKKLGL
jgi:hypothetical protein